MEKIEYNGEIYYLIKGKFVDESFLGLPTGLNAQVANAYYSNLDYKSKTYSELLSIIKEVKMSENYTLCVVMCEYALDKFATEDDFIKSLLPIYTSCLREFKQFEKAINVGENYSSYKYQSVSLFTSLAAAYCDKFELYPSEEIGYIAKKYADRAYAMQGGSNVDHLELSRVYSRIKRIIPE